MGGKEAWKRNTLNIPLEISFVFLTTTGALTLYRYSQYLCIIRLRPLNKVNTIVHQTEYTN